MAGLSDTDCRNGSGHYSVVIYSTRDRPPKIWRNFAHLEQAQAELAILHGHRFDAEILRVGDPA